MHHFTCCGCYKSAIGISKILVGIILYGGPNMLSLIGIGLNYLAKIGGKLVETSPHMFWWPCQVSSDREVKGCAVIPVIKKLNETDGISSILISGALVSGYNWLWYLSTKSGKLLGHLPSWSLRLLCQGSLSWAAQLFKGSWRIETPSGFSDQNSSQILKRILQYPFDKNA